MARRLGRAWGNALGGWRRQARTASGQWGKSSALGGKAALRYQKGITAEAVATSRSNIKKGKAFTAKGVKKARTAEGRDRLKKQGQVRAIQRYRRSKKDLSVVPYARLSSRSVTGGVNAGTSITKGLRISTGAYVRIERRGQTKFEKQSSANYDRLLQNVAPHPFLVKPLKGAIQKTINTQIFGRKYKVGSGQQVSFGTSRNLSPSIKIEGKGKTNRVSIQKRGQGITEYQNAMQARAGKANARKAMNARPQRRKKNGKR